MKLSELIRQIRRHLAEAGTGAHRDDKDVVPELNRAARNYATEHTLFKGRATLSAVNGMVAVPDDLVGVIGVTVPSRHVTLYPIDPEDVALDPFPTPAQHGYPQYYSFDEAWGRQLTVHPAHSVDLNVVYRRAPADMVNPDDQPWGGAHAAYHDLIALKAAHQLQGQTGVSAAKDVIWIQRLAQREQEFLGYLALQNLDTPPMRIRTGPRRPRRYQYD